ncbi:unnamed protein product [Caenorhabditis sp. 36 PRJEB53466]|nr:unnamed protein product [Caenorhabditis sp. 36 PRJEB53466]
MIFLIGANDASYKIFLPIYIMHDAKLQTFPNFSFILLELLLDILAVYYVLKCVYITVTIRTFHKNMTILIVLFAAQWFLVLFANFLTKPYEMGWLTIGETSNLIVNFVSQNPEYMVKVASGSGHELFFFAGFLKWYYVFSMAHASLGFAVERAAACYFLNDYEKTPRSYLAVFILIGVQGYSLGVTFLIFYNQFYFPWPYFLIGGYNGISLMLFFYCHRYNTKVTETIENFSNPDNYTLAARFQAKENIRCFQMIYKVIIAGIVSIVFNCSVLIFIYLGTFEQFDNTLNFLFQGVFSFLCPLIICPTIIYSVEKTRGKMEIPPDTKLRIRFGKSVMPVGETKRLLSGYEMPVFGFGTWQLSRGIAGERVREALEVGYRHIDCATGFGNQAECAEGIKEWCRIRKVKREELFISSKIWNTFHSYNRCVEEVNKILEEFGTDYLDLVLIHWPYGWLEGGTGTDYLFPRGRSGKMEQSTVDFMETYRALEAAHRQKKIRSIGLANFNLKQIERVWTESTVKPAVVQVELNPYITQMDIRNWCSERGIVVCAHMPIGNPGSNVFRKSGDPNLLYDDILQPIARGHGKTVVQIILRWIFDSGLTAVVKTSDMKRIKQNVNVFKFRLTPEQMAQIDSLNRDFRILNPIIGNFENPHFPWPHRPIQ